MDTNDGATVCLENLKLEIPKVKKRKRNNKITFRPGCPEPNPKLAAIIETDHCYVKTTKENVLNCDGGQEADKTHEKPQSSLNDSLTEIYAHNDYSKDKAAY